MQENSLKMRIVTELDVESWIEHRPLVKKWLAEMKKAESKAIRDMLLACFQKSEEVKHERLLEEAYLDILMEESDRDKEERYVRGFRTGSDGCPVRFAEPREIVASKRSSEGHF